MPKFVVNYSTGTNYEIVITAKSAEDAEQKVRDEDFNEDDADILDQTSTEVNNVEELCPKIV